MIRGFFVGSLALIAVYVLVQQGTADKVSSAGGITVTLLQKLLSPGVAAIPDRTYSAGKLGKAKTGVGAATGATAAEGAHIVAGSILGGIAGGGLAAGAGKA